MKQLIILIFFFLPACCETPSEFNNVEYSYAHTVIDSAPGNIWEIGLVSTGEKINNSLIIQGGSDDNEYSNLVYRNKPFAVVLNITEFKEMVVVTTFIDDVNQGMVTIDEEPSLPIVIIYPNGDFESAIRFSEEIKFKSTIIIM